MLSVVSGRGDTLWPVGKLGARRRRVMRARHVFVDGLLRGVNGTGVPAHGSGVVRCVVGHSGARAGCDGAGHTGIVNDGGVAKQPSQARWRP